MTPERLELLLHFYKDMLRCRFFEEKILHHMLPNRLFHGSTHLAIGQEAVAVGVVHALLPEDFIFSTHRGHAHCLARGMDPEGVFAEIMGRATGVCRGRGGSMHLAAADLGILGENPVVGSNVPMAAGAALALKMRGQTGVVACFFGDGATNTGAWHEALNMAALWDLPVVFLCENNLYAISVPLKAAMANAAIEERAIGYGIAGYRVDGMNVLEVHDFAKAAIDEARDAGRPSFLVFDTYRFTGHHASDSEQYRPKDEVLREFRERDPIHFIEREMGEKCEIDPVTMADMRTEIRDEIEAAFARASDAPWPDPETLFEGLYAEGGGPHE